MADKRTRNLDSISDEAFTVTGDNPIFIPIDREGFSEQKKLNINQLVSGKEYVMGVGSWNFRESRFKKVDSIPQDFKYYEIVGVYDDYEDQHNPNDIFDLELAGKCGIEVRHRMPVNATTDAFFPPQIYAQRLAFGLRYHTVTTNVGGSVVKSIMLSHNYPTRIDDGWSLDTACQKFYTYLEGGYGDEAIIPINTKRFLMVDHGALPRIGDYIYCTTNYFPLNTYVTNIYRARYTDTVGRDDVTFNPKSNVYVVEFSNPTASEFYMVDPFPGFRFVRRNRPFDESLQYGLETNQTGYKYPASIVNVENGGGMVLDANDMQYFTDLSVIRVKIKFIL